MNEPETHWKNIEIVQLFTDNMPNDWKLKVKAGTQIIHQVCQLLKQSIGTIGTASDSAALTARLRSVQDLWLKTAAMLATERVHDMGPFEFLCYVCRSIPISSVDDGPVVCCWLFSPTASL